VPEVIVGDVVILRPGDTVPAPMRRSRPAIACDVLTAIRLAKATVRTRQQNLCWAAIDNLITIPVAAGAPYPGFGLMLRPESGALAMSASSIPVVANALLPRRASSSLIDPEPERG
jgi:hypothetical protein